jgi:hypothetical protein
MRPAPTDLLLPAANVGFTEIESTNRSNYQATWLETVAEYPTYKPEAKKNEDAGTKQEIHE